MKQTLFLDLGEFAAAHRQWKHTGKCFKVHGHNWRVEVEVEAEKVDDQGFIIDVGELKETLRPLVVDLLDHTLLICEDDPEKHWFLCMEERGIVNLKVLPEVSMEFLAKHLLTKFNDRLHWGDLAKRKVRVTKVRVWEDGRSYVEASIGQQKKLKKEVKS